MTRRLLFALLLVAASANADEWKFGGHAKYQFTHTDFRADDLNAVVGDDPAQDHDLDLRLKAERRSGAWDAAVHYELLATRGDSTATRRLLAALGIAGSTAAGGLPDDRRRLFDLTHTLTDSGREAAVHRLDRLSLGYVTESAALRAGRQAVSWGNGLVFHPLDFINPFAPLAIDKDYKTGDDMLFGQWTLAASADVQAIVVPRRAAATRDIDSAESTAALKWRQRVGAFDLDAIGARHYDDSLVGIGIVRSLGGAVWRLDLRHDDAWLGATNVDYSWTWFGHNVYGYLEYFRNGVGESTRRAYVTPNAELAARIARGELYTLARDYLALGMQFETDPLVNLFASAIWNLNDRSGVVQLRLVYDWRQDAQWLAGVGVPFGERGDEFGGIPVAGTGAFLTAGRSAFVRLAYFF
jgi:hypothetical protein